MNKDPEEQAHLEWIGYVQPVGLVVSIPALLAAQAHVNRNIIPDHQRFIGYLPTDTRQEPIFELRDLVQFTTCVLGWRETDLEPIEEDDPRHTDLEIVLPEFHVTLRPTYAVREAEPNDPSRPWMMLVQELPAGTPLDAVATADDRNWQASPQVKFERLLRETQIPVGLLSNATSLRLVYVPRIETSGHATFNVAEMTQVAGRPIFAPRSLGSRARMVQSWVQHLPSV